MTDKVQKICEEVEKLKSQLLRGACSSQVAMETRCKEEAYNEVLGILDSMQEEPKKCMYSKDNYTDEDRKVLCDGCEEECKFAKKEAPTTSVWHDASEKPEIDRNILLIASNGNSSLALWDGKNLKSCTLGGGHSVFCKNDKWAYIDELIKL